jgi:hypothetical protein
MKLITDCMNTWYEWRVGGGKNPVQITSIIYETIIHRNSVPSPASQALCPYLNVLGIAERRSASNLNTVWNSWYILPHLTRRPGCPVHSLQSNREAYVIYITTPLFYLLFLREAFKLHKLQCPVCGEVMEGYVAKQALRSWRFYLEFVWSYWVKSRNLSVKIIWPWNGNWTLYFPNMKKKWWPTTTGYSVWLNAVMV